MYEAVEMKLKVHCNPQQVGDSRNTYCVPVKAIGREQIQSQEEAIWASIGKTLGRPTKALWNSYLSTMFLMLDMKLCNLMFALLTFTLALALFHSVPLFFPLRMSVFILYHCTLEIV